MLIYFKGQCVLHWSAESLTQINLSIYLVYSSKMADVTDLADSGHSLNYSLCYALTFSTIRSMFRMVHVTVA